MNDQETQALDESIVHWERLRKAVECNDPHSAEIEEWKSESCKLCELYLKDGEDDCPGCPVQEHTGSPFCEETPWLRANNALTKWVFPYCRRSGDEEDARINALHCVASQSEFLRRLREKGTTGRL